MSHADLIDAVWAAVTPGAEPDRFAQRRDWLLDRVAPGERVLDLGCGEGHFSRALMAHGARVVALDASAEAVRRAQAGGVAAALTPLDGPVALDDGAVDVVWAGEVVEHVVDVQGLLSEVRRVLPSTGRLLLTTPDHPATLIGALAADAQAFAEHFSPRADHLRFFNEVSLHSVVTDAGFAVDELEADAGTLLIAATRERW